MSLNIVYASTVFTLGALKYYDIVSIHGYSNTIPEDWIKHYRVTALQRREPLLTYSTEIVRSGGRVYPCFQASANHVQRVGAPVEAFE